MSIHHATIRKYTAGLLDFFSKLEISYQDSAQIVKTRNIPIVYSSTEKYNILKNITEEQQKSGNHNVLPRSSLSLSTLVRAETRMKNKNLKINRVSTAEKFEYMYNSMPYEFTFELSIICRGMNEATQIIEQIGPMFNPNVNIDIWDASNLHEPTRIPVKLLDIGIQTEEYEEMSSNLVTVDVGLSIQGNLYPAVNTVDRIKDFKMYLNEQEGDYFSRKSILGWDIDDSGKAVNGTKVTVQENTQYAPSVVDIVSTGVLAVGTNSIIAIFDDKDNKITELTFEWSILQGDATISNNLDNATLTILTGGTIEVRVKITDVYGNFNTLDKIFIV